MRFSFSAAVGFSLLAGSVAANIPAIEIKVCKRSVPHLLLDLEQPSHLHNLHIGIEILLLQQWD